MKKTLFFLLFTLSASIGFSQNVLYFSDGYIDSIYNTVFTTETIFIIDNSAKTLTQKYDSINKTFNIIKVIENPNKDIVTSYELEEVGYNGVIYFAVRHTNNVEMVFFKEDEDSPEYRALFNISDTYFKE